MTASTLITGYLSEGTAASRPATPNLPASGLAFYYATDTGVMSFYDLSTTAWVSISASSLPTNYSMTLYGQNIASNAFATVGAAFIPSQNITISEIEAFLKPASGGLQVEFSICSVTIGAGPAFTVNAQLYVSPSAIVTAGTVPILVKQTLAAPLALTAGTMYAILVTGTNLAGATTAMPLVQNAVLVHDNWPNMPKEPINITSSFYDLALTAQIASLTPPTSGTFTMSDSNQVSVGCYWQFTAPPP